MRISDWSSDVCSSDLVMLVLLIIFLITVPVVIQTVPLQLPQVVNEPTTTKPENVALSAREVNGQCETYWGVQRVPDKKTLLASGVGALRAEIERQEAMTGSVTAFAEVPITGAPQARSREERPAGKRVPRK